MQKSDTIGALAAALAKAQAALPSAVKDAVNPHFRSKYADLAAIWQAARKPLADNGLSVVQLPTEAGDGKIGLTYILMHTSGEWISDTVSSPIVKNDPQGVGSALTYLRRYSLAALVGIVADEDDDGNAASQAPRDTERTQGAAYQAQPATNGNGGSPVTPKQANTLIGLWSRGKFEGELDTWIQESYNCTIYELTTKQASNAIEALQQPVKK